MDKEAARKSGLVKWGFLFAALFCTLLAIPLAAADLTGIWTGVGSLTFKDRFILTLQADEGSYVGTISTASGSIKDITLQEVAFT